jgi:hypothetical protein
MIESTMATFCEDKIPMYKAIAEALGSDNWEVKLYVPIIYNGKTHQLVFKSDRRLSNGSCSGLSNQIIGAQRMYMRFMVNN